MQRKIRVLVGKPGLDGHDRGAKVVAAALRDAGMEVIYTGLHQTPEQVVEAAVQEDVDVVALSVLSGAHMTLFPEILELMRARGIGDRLLSGGGIIPNDDMAALMALGVGRLFGPGTNTQNIVAYIREWYAGIHGAASLPPLPPPPGRPEAKVAGESEREAPGSARPVPAPARPDPRVKRSSGPATVVPAGKRTAGPASGRTAAPAGRRTAAATSRARAARAKPRTRPARSAKPSASKSARSTKPRRPSDNGTRASRPTKARTGAKRSARSVSRKRG